MEVICAVVWLVGRVGLLFPVQKGARHSRSKKGFNIMWLHGLIALLLVAGAQGSFEVEVAGLKVRAGSVVPWPCTAAACVPRAAGVYPQH